MSRYTISVPAGGETSALTAAYGFDPALGFWIDILRNPDDDIPLLTYCSLYDGTHITREAFEKWGVPDEHYHSMLLDLPF